MKKLVALALGAVMLSGCTVRIADFTVTSTKNYNINGNRFAKGARVTGEDSYPVILFPLGIPNVKTATDKAIEQDQCAVGLSNVVMTALNHNFIFGITGWRVEGDLIVDHSLLGCENAGTTRS